MEKGQLIVKKNQLADKIIVIIRGVCEVYTDFESNEFVIETLEEGSIINSNSFFLEDQQWIDIRCASPCSFLIMTQESL